MVTLRPFFNETTDGGKKSYGEVNEETRRTMFCLEIICNMFIYEEGELKLPCFFLKWGFFSRSRNVRQPLWFRDQLIQDLFDEVSSISCRHTWLHA